MRRPKFLEKKASWLPARTTLSPEEQSARDKETTRAAATRRARPASVSSDGMLHCPNCGGTQLSAGNKGFCAGKALAGGILVGGLGLLAGFWGSKKIEISCLHCGHQWQAGQ